jgi:hypothetical protein
MASGQMADHVTTAPKKKQEKMNLGEFLTNQCEWKTFATSEAILHLSLAPYRATERMGPDHEKYLILTVDV